MDGRAAALFVVVCVALVACGETEQIGSPTTSTSAPREPPTTPLITTAEPMATSTSTPEPTTGAPQLPSIISLEDPEGTELVGLMFEAGAKVGWVDGEYRRLDSWVLDQDALHNVGHWVVRLFVDGEPVDLWVWHEGSRGGGRPTSKVLVIGVEPNPYAPGEYAQEIEGVEPRVPDPSAEHRLAIWAVDEIAPGRWLITDVEGLVRSGANMGYGALVEIRREYNLCDVDRSIAGDLYAYFDHEDPVMEEHYPATLAFTVSPEGEISRVDGDLIFCILAPDWETRGY